MRTFLINLDRSRERFDAVQKRFNELNIAFERFSAVDGRVLPLEQKRNSIARVHSRLARHNRLTDGEIGCALSHVTLMKRIVDEDIPSAVILEDDILVDDRFKEMVDFVQSWIDPAKPQVVMLSSFTGKCETGNVPKKIVEISNELCTDAYIVTRAAAANIYRANFPVVTVADSWLRWRKRGLIKLYHAIPTMVRQDIGTYKSEVNTDHLTPLRGLRKLLWKTCRMFEVTLDNLWWLVLGK